MGKQFAVLHVTKFNGSSGGIGAHIDRKHTPKNADPDRLELNREFIESNTGSMKKDIDRRISEGYTSKRKIRKDAVKAVGVILSGSPGQMKKIEGEGRLEEWAKANFKFAQEKFGKENLVRFTLHMDEATPHIHAVFTPIKDGKLHYKSFIDGKKGLSNLQEEYGLKMADFGLKRGLKHSRAKHTTTREYYAKMEDVKPVKIKTNILGRPKEGEEERITEEIKKVAAKAFSTEVESSRVQRSLSGYKDAYERLQERLKESNKRGLHTLDLLKKVVVNKDEKLSYDLEKNFFNKQEQTNKFNQGPKL